MNMLDLNPCILKVSFLDNAGQEYIYVGRWCADNKYEFNDLIKFVYENKIEYQYIYRSKGPKHWAVKIYPSSVESAVILFNTKWRDKLFKKRINN